MVQEIKIRCKNNKKTLQLPIGSTLWDAYHALNLQMPYGPVSAKAVSYTHLTLPTILLV